MFYFNPNTYSTEYFVMEDTEQDALRTLKSYIEGKGDEYIRNRWMSAEVDSLPEGYTLESFDTGEVVETEIP